MQDIYAVVEGNFGKLVVLEVTQNLVTHAHSQMQLGFWLGGGRARCRVGSTESVLANGLITACNSYESHDLVLSSPSEPVIALMLYLDLEWMDQSKHGWLNPVQFATSQIFETPEIKECSAALMRKVLSSHHLDGEGVEDDVVKLLRLTLEQAAISTHCVVPPPIRRRMPDYRLRMALAYMKENITHVGLMGHLAKVVAVSRSRLYELFLDEIQSSPKVIWNSMRTEEAMRRIANSDESMAAVGAALGFSSAGNFSRFFKANTGVSPFEYRRITSQIRHKKPRLFSVMYTSVAVKNMSDAELDDILETARKRNASYQVTGVLLYAEGRFMQYLEGGLSDLHEVLMHIKSSRQHCNLEIAELISIERRAYKGWTMAFVSKKNSHSTLVVVNDQMNDFLNTVRQRA